MNATPLVVGLLILGAILLFKFLGQARPTDVRDQARRGARIIDVRTRTEFSDGHLPQAVNIPLGELQDRISEVAPDKNQLILLHCASGARSESAKRVLRGMGYRHAQNVGSYARARRLLASEV